MSFSHNVCTLGQQRACGTFACHRRLCQAVHQQIVYNKLTGRGWYASGKTAPLVGALASGLNAAQTLGQAFSHRPAFRASAPSRRAAAPSQLTLPESASAAALPQDVAQSNWEEEEGEYTALPQLTDAQWAQIAKVSKRTIRMPQWHCTQLHLIIHC